MNKLIKISAIACLLSMAVLTINSCKKDDVVDIPTPDSLTGTSWSQQSGVSGGYPAYNILSFTETEFDIYWQGAVMAKGTYTYSKPNVTFNNTWGMNVTATGVVSGNKMTVQGFLSIGGGTFTLSE